MNLSDCITTIILDVDGTLTEPWTDKLLRGRITVLEQARNAGRKLYLATNQGGVGYHLYHRVVQDGREHDLPGLVQAAALMERLVAKIKAHRCYMAIHPGDTLIAEPIYNAGLIDTDGIIEMFGSKVRACFRKDWRKPQPGMLKQLLADERLNATECIYVGNSQIDFDAALGAGIAPADPDEFFYS